MAYRTYLQFLNGAFIADASPKLQLAVGGGLMTTPAWALLVQDVSMIASMVAAVCGAIIGLFGVIKLFRKKER
jgi:hypothetical protein